MTLWCAFGDDAGPNIHPARPRRRRTPAGVEERRGRVSLRAAHRMLPSGCRPLTGAALDTTLAERVTDRREQGVMRVHRIAVPSLVAALAACGALAAAAHATPHFPEFGKCEAVAKGAYLDAGCTERAATSTSGTFRWVKPLENPETVLSAGGPAVLEDVNGNAVDCESSTSSWKLPLRTNYKVIDAVIHFHGCHDPGLASSCHSEGAEPSEVVTGELEGFLGFVSGRETFEPVAGLSLLPMDKKVHKAFGQFKCGIRTITIGSRHGGGQSVISTIAPLNTMTSTFTRDYATSGVGVQAIERFQGGTLDILEMAFGNTPFVHGSLNEEVTTTTEAPEEIRAFER
jgi:hypothetical protein